MKSLRYILGGRPHTLDDCIDFARSRPPKKVTVNLAASELTGELRILQQFVGHYRWEFGDRNACCTEVYGCVFLPATQQEQRSSLAAANTRLRRRLEEIQRRGIKLAGTRLKFERSEYPCGRM